MREAVEIRGVARHEQIRGRVLHRRQQAPVGVGPEARGVAAARPKVRELRPRAAQRRVEPEVERRGPDGVARDRGRRHGRREEVEELDVVVAQAQRRARRVEREAHLEEERERRAVGQRAARQAPEPALDVAVAAELHARVEPSGALLLAVALGRGAAPRGAGRRVARERAARGHKVRAAAAVEELGEARRDLELLRRLGGRARVAAEEREVRDAHGLVADGEDALERALAEEPARGHGRRDGRPGPRRPGRAPEGEAARGGRRGGLGRARGVAARRRRAAAVAREREHAAPRVAGH